MSDRGRGRGRQQYDARPLGRMPDYAGRGALGRPGLGSMPQRSSSSGLASLGLAAGSAAGLSAAGLSAAGSAGGGAGGRGAGPDHREVRYAEGVLAMINILRVLTLGGPHTSADASHKQMVVAQRPAPGVAGREVNLLVNHFSLGLRINSAMQVYQINVTDINPAAHKPQQQQQQQDDQQQQQGGQQQQHSSQHQHQLPRGLVQRVLQQLALQSGWPPGWVLVGHDRLAASSLLLEDGVAAAADAAAAGGSSGSSSSRREFVVKLLPGTEDSSQGAAAAAAAGEDGSSSSSSSNSWAAGTFKVVLQYLGPHDLSDLRSQAAAAAAGSNSGPLLDGIKLLEALLVAAALHTPAAAPAPPPAPLAAATPSGINGVLVNGPMGSAGGVGVLPLGEPTAPIAVPGVGLAATTAAGGGGGTGLLGLAGVTSGGGAGSLTGSTLAGSHLLGGQQQQQQQQLLPSSPAGTGLLSAAVAGTPGGLAAVGSGGSSGGANAAAAAAAAGGSSSAITAAAAAGFPGVGRVLVDDVVYLRAPGNPELHVALGGGLEGWLGFKQVVTQTQSGPAMIVDLTASPFHEPGPLTDLLAALLGLPVPAQDDTAAAAAAAAAAAGGGSNGSSGSSSSSTAAAVVTALSGLSAAEWRVVEQHIQGVKVEVSLPGQSPRSWHVRGLSHSGANATTFTLNSSSSSRRRQTAAAAGLSDGVSVSVAAYFKSVYGVELAAPQLPCVNVGRPGGQDIWYPLELCSVPAGQRFLSPLTQQQLTVLGRLASKKAADKRTWLEGIVGPLATASSGSSSSNGAAAAAAATLQGPFGSLSLEGPAAIQQAGSLGAAAAGGSSGSSGPLLPSGLDVSGMLGVVRGRVLPPPHLAYHTPECAYPGSQGQWNVKMCRLPGTSRIISWSLVVLMPQAAVDVDGPAGVVPFLQDLTTSLNGSGIECSIPPIVYEQPGLSVLQHLRAGVEAAQRHFSASPDVLLVMLPSRSPGLYQEVKVATDAALGVPSQVLVAPVAGVGHGAQPRGRLQYCNNIGLKINAKLGGVNVRLAGNPDQVIPVIGSRPFMLFGVAVAPPPRGSPPGSPAAAAVVASRDRSLGRYSSRVLLQHLDDSAGACAAAAGAAGVVLGLKGAAKELLIDFYRQNGGRKPEALLVYRATGHAGAEGSSSGGPGRLSTELLQAEYDALRAACTELEEGYRPPITYVGVTRRHSTRLFPADRDNQDKSGNCVPGTVVDTGICHPTQFDFFLNSHAGLQGHNKPAHYHVLVDENGFSSDGLQLLTYWLCYLYCRCSRSVSIVPPAYYAQLAAERGQILARGREVLSSRDMAALAADEAAAEAADQVDFDVRVNVRLGGSMYYV